MLVDVDHSKIKRAHTFDLANGADLGIKEICDSESHFLFYVIVKTLSVIDVTPAF
ncbi:MAG: Unknown protein [uncultured Thiotrichaceae bacterium]|uniref:Uncharacterized protein n=1 Tax=uncultured Thiotrichaceae bacterium TaxID=298394 RepID=A0A6S6SD43_9GAMM|nr:MAG: Unknown protein [uncultured Thiotrichaceae bacterium]